MFFFKQKQVISLQNKHTWYITASLFHRNIKVYIFITILERKDQVKKRTCSLGCSSCFFLFFFFLTVRRKRKDLDSRTGRPQCRVAIDLCTYEEGRQSVALGFHTHLHPHTSTHRSVVSPTFLKPCSPLYPWTRCEKKHRGHQLDVEFWLVHFMVRIVTSRCLVFLKVLLWR